MMLVQRLKAMQDAHGYLPEAELNYLASETKTPLYRIQEVASFFPHFRFAPPPPVAVQVCRDMACHLRGSRDLIRKMEEIPGCHVEGVSCLGRCDRAVAMVVSRHEPHAEGETVTQTQERHAREIHEHIYAGRSALEMVQVVHEVVAGGTPKADTDLANPVETKDWQIDPYNRGERKGKPPGYEAIQKIVAEYKDPVTLTDAPPLKPKLNRQKHTREETGAHEAGWPDKFVKEKYNLLGRLKDEDLRGMGGAGQQAYLKWFTVWKTKAASGADDKYIVCNGDESEPATFKDRELLLRYPHLVVEGVIAAGLLTNAKAGFIYIRHEYQEQIRSVEEEIERAKGLGACGGKIFKSNRAFEVSVFTSPGGYICGEESALIEAMEDRRGQPRNKPPEMATNGYLDKPTVVNNVETMAWVPAILLEPASWYKKAGQHGATGRRFFSLCGDVAKPGVFEVSCGTSLGELIEMAGGMRDGLKPYAMALSGPSGGLLPVQFPTPTMPIPYLTVAMRAEMHEAGILQAGKDSAKDEERKLHAKIHLDKETPELFASLAERLKQREQSDEARKPLTARASAMATIEAEVENKTVIYQGLSSPSEQDRREYKQMLAMAKEESLRVEDNYKAGLRKLQDPIRRAHMKSIVDANLTDVDKSELQKAQAKAVDRAKESQVAFRKLFDAVMPDPAATHLDLLRLPLDKGLLATLGGFFGVEFMLGAGMAVYAEGTDVFDHAVRYTEFFRNESCGKCVPCRLGSQQLVEIGQRFLAARTERTITAQSLEMVRTDVEDLHRTLNETSICGLGRAAGNALQLALKLFPAS